MKLTGVESHLSKTEKKISLKAKVLDAWNSMSEWEQHHCRVQPGGDRWALVQC
jgi:hypothetical protein